MEKIQSVDFTALFMVVQTKTYASLVSTSPKSISDKKKRRKAITSPQNRFFFNVRTNFRHTFPSSQLQCLPRGDPRNLCANTRIQLLATHLLAKSKFAVNGSLLSSRGSINWCRNYGAKRRLRAKLLSSV